MAGIRRAAATIAGRAVFLFGAAFFCACSIVLDWGEEGLLCDRQAALEQQDDVCEQGFSCLGRSCIANGSLALGKKCASPEQCRDHPSNTCVPPLYVCRKACVDIYASDACKTGQYCKPYILGTTSYAAACEDSQMCATGGGCADGQICVPLSSSASDCFSACTPTWDQDGQYSDGCVSSEEANPLACQPLGPDSVFACVPMSSPQQGDGDICTPVTNPCVRGSACIDGICRKYCDMDDSGGDACTGDNTSCCLLKDTVGVCKKDCS